MARTCREAGFFMPAPRVLAVVEERGMGFGHQFNSYRTADADGVSSFVG
jgi:hypothetical protein